MNTRVFKEGRQLIALLLEEWPAPRCDATDGAYIYLAYSCNSCGTLIWPEDERSPAVPHQTVCDSCLKPNVLTFPDGELLLSTLQEIVFAWPRGFHSQTLQTAQRFLQMHTVSNEGYGR